MMTEAEYKNFVERRRAAYPITWAEEMSRLSTKLGSFPNAATGDSLTGSSSSSPVLPLASQDTTGDDSMTVAADSLPASADDAETPRAVLEQPIVGDSNVPALMVAETHGALDSARR